MLRLLRPSPYLKKSLDKRLSNDYSVLVSENRMIDGIDRQIIQIVQQDARISNAEIARQVGLAPSAVLERLRKMEERGVIRGYHADIDPSALDFGLTAFVAVRSSECGTAEEALSEIPEVLEFHDVAGEDSYWLKIRTKNTEELGRLLTEKIKPIPTVLGTRTTIVLQTFKETTALPIRTGPDSNQVSKKRAKGSK